MFHPCYNKTMNDQRQSSPSNPETKIKHQRQFWVQIMLPVLLGTAAIVTAGIFAASGPGDRPAVWANISTILMVIMMFGIGIILLLALSLAIFGSDWLLRKLPYYSYIVQIYITYYGKKINDLSTSSAKPVVGIHSVIAGIKRIFNLRPSQLNSSRED